MKRNQVVLIHGLPASGKYSIAKAIQDNCGGILLDNHYFYDMFLGKTEIPDSEDAHQLYFRYVDVLRNAYLDVLRKFYPRTHNTRYIFTSVLMQNEKMPIELQEFARDIDADYIPIELGTCREILLERCNTTQRKKREKLSNKDKYDTLLDQWITNTFHSTHPNKLVLDSSNLTLSDTFALVKKHLEKFD